MVLLTLIASKDKQIVITMLQGIVLLGAYINIEQWSVNKMKEPYEICLLALIFIFY
jgi:hypothetical protein